MEDSAFIDRLRAGDEGAYRELVRRHHMSLVRLARTFCRTHATAEEVVQETWITVVTALDTYSGLAPFKSWLAGIVVNKARTRAVRDGRVLSFSDLAQADDSADGAGFDLERFASSGAWLDPPLPWDGVTPEREVAGRQLLEHLADALETLPPAQKAVVLLRDVEGLESVEIARVLEITEGHLRVLLHRARTRLRALLEGLLTPPRAATQSDVPLVRTRPR